jgi:uncharacterized damage-inducible protein DinB
MQEIHSPLSMIERPTFIPCGDSPGSYYNYVIGILNDARITTLQRVEGISTEELHWQYAEGWNTIGALLQHMISTENFFRIVYVEQRELTVAEAEEWIPGLEMGEYLPALITGQSIDEYIYQLDLSRRKMLKQIKSLSKEEFYRRRKRYDPKKGYNLAWLLFHQAEDEVHHRGQISILRKLYQDQSSKFKD